MTDKKPSIPKLESNMVVIEFGYNSSLIMPHEAGVKFLELIKFAEHLSGGFTDRVIEPIEKARINITSLSRQEYLEIKMKQLIKSNSS